MLSEPKEGTPNWRCWNGLSKEEFDALTESRAPLEGCVCRGCQFLSVRGWKPIARADLLARTLNRSPGNDASVLNQGTA